MLATILGVLRGLFGFLGQLSALLHDKQERDAGAAAEAGKVSEVAAKTEAAIAEAEVAAPATKAGVIESLNKGEF